MPAGNPFRAKASRSRLGSTARTNGNQGGGEKKAGLPPTMRLTQASNLAFRHRHPILLSMASLIQTANPRVNPTHPISSQPKNFLTRRWI
jgi:hypothetical protein